MARALRQHQKDRLRNILSQMRVADLPPRRGVNQVHVAEHHRRKGILGACAGIFAEQFKIAVTLHRMPCSPDNRRS